MKIYDLCVVCQNKHNNLNNLEFYMCNSCQDINKLPQTIVSLIPAWIIFILVFFNFKDNIFNLQTISLLIEIIGAILISSNYWTEMITGASGFGGNSLQIRKYGRRNLLNSQLGLSLLIIGFILQLISQIVIF